MGTLNQMNVSNCTPHARSVPLAYAARCKPTQNRWCCGPLEEGGVVPFSSGGGGGTWNDCGYFQQPGLALCPSLVELRREWLAERGEITSWRMPWNPSCSLQRSFATDQNSRCKYSHLRGGEDESANCSGPFEAVPVPVPVPLPVAVHAMCPRPMTPGKR